MPQITQLPLIFASQLFWLALVFGFIFFVMGRGMLPKIRSTVKARETKIADDLEQAKAARARAEETEAEWRARMDDARRDAALVAQEARRQSALETEARVREALNEIDAKVEGARSRIRAAVQAARAEMEIVATEAAQQMVEQLTGLKIDRKDAAKAIAAELDPNGAIIRHEAATSVQNEPQPIIARVN